LAVEVSPNTRLLAIGVEEIVGVMLETDSSIGVKTAEAVAFSSS